MFSWLKRLFGDRHCAFCKKKTDEPRKYWNDKGEPIVICPMCVEYAERRAFNRR